MANQSFGRNIMAALSLGNMDFLDADMDWVEGLLVNHYEMPESALDSYVEVYFEACLELLDKSGYPVVEWMARLLGRELPQGLKATLREKAI